MSLVILDRDGVINQDSAAFIKSPDEWIPIPGSLEAIAKLKQAGYQVVVATNQSGLARGLFNIENLTAIHSKMLKMLAELGGDIDAIFYCPHGPDDGCTCRKPGVGMFLEIADRLSTPLANVPAIGDALRDIQAAQCSGAKAILVGTGKGQHTVEQHADTLADTPYYTDLATAVDAILEDDE